MTKFSTWFIIFGVILQVLCYFITGDSWLSLVSGILGVISVVLCSDRKFSFYIFGFLQLFTYLILVFKNHLWGEVGENIFYLVTMVLGLFIWRENMEGGEVKSKSLSPWVRFILGVFSVVGIYGLWRYLETTNDPQPLLDSITTVPAFIAQILMILCFREQWIFWLIIDIGSIVLWYNAGSWCMVFQYIFWTSNCVYGWIRWRKTL